VSGLGFGHVLGVVVGEMFSFLFVLYREPVMLEHFACALRRSAACALPIERL
jgi:hypothetical protein